MDMTVFAYYPVVLALLAVAAIALVWAIRRARRRRIARLPYTCRRAVLSETDRALFAALRGAAGEHAVVLVRVPLRDVLAPRRTLRGGQQHRALARLEDRRVDFLLCAPDDTRPLVAIVVERDASGMEEWPTQFIEDACAAGGLGLLRIDPTQRYSPEMLHDALRRWIEPRPADIDADPLLDGRREPILDLPEDD